MKEGAREWVTDDEIKKKILLDHIKNSYIWHNATMINRILTQRQHSLVLTLKLNHETKIKHYNKNNVRNGNLSKTFSITCVKNKIEGMLNNTVK